MDENKKQCSPPDYEELADILTAISVVAKRLSRQILKEVPKDDEKDGVPNGS